MKVPAVKIPARPHAAWRAAGTALLLLASQPGCGREFFREWANQDVSEAIYEKSRDPRFRIDLFSVDPPAMSRFADPYDPDRPPAPPDDFATEAMSPVPQWPDHRLMMPAEGTGYLALLEKDSRRYQPPPPQPAPPSTERPPVVPTTPPPEGSTSPFLPKPEDFAPANDPQQDRNAPRGIPPAIPGPAAARPNSGTKPGGLTPTPVAAKTPQSPARVASTGATRDDGLRRTAAQDTPQPMPSSSDPSLPRVPPTPAPPRSSVPPGQDPLKPVPTPMDPNQSDSRLDVPVNPRPDLRPDQAREAEEATANLSGLFVPENIPINEATAVGLPPTATPVVLTMEKALELALVNARIYQFQLENLYLAALPVTLQRFTFQPQFLAGLSPLSTGLVTPGPLGAVGIGPAVTPANSFLYSTRETGGQVSTLNLGTVAGVGKAFDAGGKLLASFASSIIFNFSGQTPTQPTVRSFIPIQFVQPLLRGGGRAVTLEILTQAERSLIYQIRLFAKFRQEFVVSVLAGGGQIQQFGTTAASTGFTVGGNSDPSTGFLNVVEDAQLVENNVKNVAVFDRIYGVYKELIQGENNSGLTQLQVDQVDQGRQSARLQLLNAQISYRNDIDSLKIQYGMPPDTPLVVDRSRTRGFHDVFENIDKWALSPRRELSELDGIIAGLPELEEVVVEGRSCLKVFNSTEDETLEDLLRVAERVALENRLDLMNNRAQLYDAWRQIRVSANALKGVLNLSVSNQFLTPPTTNNPFGFVDQAKSFALVINGELPLVRISERNNFRTQLINYQRARRNLMNQEDFLKNQVRGDFRNLQLIYRQYLINKKNLALSVRLKDQAFEQIIAPTQPGAAGAQGAVQTTNLVQFQSSVVNLENQLVTNWYNYQTQRLSIYRDLGTLPYDEWEAFDELFPSDRIPGADAPAAAPGGGLATFNPATARPAPVGGP